MPKQVSIRSKHPIKLNVLKPENKIPDPTKLNHLEHFHKIYSDAPLVLRNNGLFGFWLCFSSVAGFSNLRLR